VQHSKHNLGKGRKNHLEIRITAKNHLDVVLLDIYTSNLIYGCHLKRLWNYCVKQ